MKKIELFLVTVIFVVAQIHAVWTVPAFQAGMGNIIEVYKEQRQNQAEKKRSKEKKIKRAWKKYKALIPYPKHGQPKISMGIIPPPSFITKNGKIKTSHQRDLFACRGK